MGNPFTIEGNWYKGNLHTHTTNSDGRKTPQETVDLYAAAGYDFLALADHWHLTAPAELRSNGLTLIPAAELDGAEGELGQTVHVVALGLEAVPERLPTKSIAEFVEHVAAHSRICFVAHPSWSSLLTHDLLPATGYLGLEVYNSTCHHGIGRGDSMVQWDGLLARGRRLCGFAVDDAHFAYDDALGGWVWVKAAEPTVPALLDAIEAGHFYASNGPEIRLVERVGDEIRVRCSPCREISLIDPMPGYGNTTHRLKLATDSVTEVSLPIRTPAGDGRAVRVECIDAEGRRAWSNPLF
jgi:hypothetical protein